MAASAMPAGGQTSATLPERNEVSLPNQSPDEVKRDENHDARERRQVAILHPFCHNQFLGAFALSELFVRPGVFCAGSGASSASRTLRASADGVNGFGSSATPLSNTP